MNKFFEVIAEVAVLSVPVYAFVVTIIKTVA
jgi:hypothetical protein